MTPRFLVALDPGLDGTGVAVFDRALYAGLAHSAANNAARALLRLDLWESDPSGSIEARVLEIVDQLRRELAELGAAEVVIEVPSYTGTYAGKSGMADGLAKLNRLIGGLLVGAAYRGQRVRTLVPDGIPMALRAAFRDVKAYRRAGVRELFRLAGRGKGDIPGWGMRAELSNQDKIDAVWAGLRALGAPTFLPPIGLGAR